MMMIMNPGIGSQQLNPRELTTTTTTLPLRISSSIPLPHQAHVQAAAIHVGGRDKQMHVGSLVKGAPVVVHRYRYVHDAARCFERMTTSMTIV